MIYSVCKVVTHVCARAHASTHTCTHMHDSDTSTHAYTNTHVHTQYSVHQVIVLVFIRQLTDEIANKEESLNKHLRSVLQYTH